MTEVTATVEPEITPMRSADCPRPVDPLIELRGVHVSYPNARGEALSGIDLEVPTGQYVCILGGNGSGKSTLLQLINALALPSAGEVRVLGMSTSDEGAPLAIRSRCASVFQHPEDQMVTSIVADDVAFGPENLCVPQPEIENRVDASLRAVGMLEYSQSDPTDLSGGQTQSVAIAGALAMKPEILLLDEPCAMLDARSRSDIRGIVDTLRRRGITIVHVTHFMEDALDADRVLVLEQGRIAFDGTAAEAFTDAERVRALGLEAPRRPAEILEIATERTASPTAGDPRVTFDRVSFSYTGACNPRRRRGPFGRRERPERDISAPLALEELSFRAFPGTLTALVGQTGSGKSTTAELACALKLPLSGAVHICGVDTADLDRRTDIRRHVGYVSQLPERQLFAETVFDDIAFGPRNMHMPEDEVRSRVCEALASVNLAPTDELLARSPFALSGGQQRSVALAGVLAMRQDVLVLDEPMAGLDPEGRRHVRDLLRALKCAGTTLIMVTHGMEDVAELADHVIVLERGRALLSGSPAEVLPALFEFKGVSPHGDSR